MGFTAILAAAIGPSPLPGIVSSAKSLSSIHRLAASQHVCLPLLGFQRLCWVLQPLTASRYDT
ncbi:hypothetical protein ACCO45_013643 [Purpureocillium lilacinum]|uniref:Uncharacterized protein n=1 Tax=Purpureocillium lilacinum TaxID=33203 RepID=A0ACC4D8R5_PURLI